MPEEAERHHQRSRLDGIEMLLAAADRSAGECPAWAIMVLERREADAMRESELKTGEPAR